MALWVASECGCGSTVPHLNVTGHAEVPFLGDHVVTGLDAETLGRIPFVRLSDGVTGLRHVFDEKGSADCNRSPRVFWWSCHYGLCTPPFPAVKYDFTGCAVSPSGPWWFWLRTFWV